MAATAKRKGKGKPGRPSGLTDEVETKILDLVRKGCFVSVAVRAAGVSTTAYKRWMHRTDARGRAFQTRVETAKAEARASREQAVYLEDPLAWLRIGPGRDAGPDEPGWTDRPTTARIEHTGPGGGPIHGVVTAQVIDPVRVLLDPELRRLACEFLERIAAGDAGNAAEVGEPSESAGGPTRGAARGGRSPDGAGDARAALAGGAGALRLEGPVAPREAPGAAQPPPP